MRFLAVWYVCAAADWLQGPYGYELYASYGFNSGEINSIFAVGFLSSLICSFFTGMGADMFGRKRMCILYCIVNVVSCCSVHFGDYWVLLCGKFIGGACTPILYTIFECWLVAEHQQRYGFSDALLSYTFGLMFSGMFVVAIVCGLVSQMVVDATGTKPSQMIGSNIFFTGGYTVPFDLTIVLMVAGAPMIAVLWDENYGVRQSGGPSIGKMVEEVARVMLADPRIPLVTIGGALFEGAMYCFVVSWVPALKSDSMEPREAPSGMVFSGFMMCCMCGSSIATLLGDTVSPQLRLAATFALGSVALVSAAGTISGDSVRATFAAFLVFEFCVGLYYPAIGMVKQEVVPERVRGTVYSMHRILMNGIALCMLLADLERSKQFAAAATLLALALLCQLFFLRCPTVGARAVEAEAGSELQSTKA